MTLLPIFSPNRNGKKQWKLRYVLTMKSTSMPDRILNLYLFSSAVLFLITIWTVVWLTLQSLTLPFMCCFPSPYYPRTLVWCFFFHILGYHQQTHFTHFIIKKKTKKPLQETILWCLHPLPATIPFLSLFT